MTLSSVVFLFIFLPVTFLLYAVFRNDTLRNIILLAASLVFYAFGEPMAVFLMIISIICNYFLGIVASRRKYDKLAIVTACILNLGMLFVFKYLGFLTQCLNDAAGISIPIPEIRLPIGISFFTFQGLSYVIDVYREKGTAQKNLFLLALYISFFPQLIAGPIVKYHDIEGQLKKREFTADRISKGICRFIVGLAKKVLIANQMGIVADAVFGASVADLSTGAAWLGVICYTLQIFFDFSGYSDMAIGLGCLFGFDFKENFNYPFISGSIQEFWRRWHISLSIWFKEYVYIPLGGNRKGKARTNINRLIVFFLTGFWHGANFTFIVWGLLHGFFLLLENNGIIPVKKKWFAPIKHIYTLLVVVLTFAIFRADTLSQGFSIIGLLFSGSGGKAAVNAQIFSNMSLMFVITLFFAVILSAPIVPKIKKTIANTSVYSVAQHIYYAGTLVMFTLCVFSLISSKYNPFIYFRF